jgi:hypothetical protein
VVSVTYDAAAKSLNAEITEEDTLADAVDTGYYPDVSIRAKQRATDGKMYLVHLAYLGQEAPAVKDLAASVKDSLGIAAADAAGVRMFPSSSERRLYLSDTPPENFLTHKKNMEESPGTGSEAHPAPEAKPETAGTGGNSAGSANPQKQAKEVLVDEKEAQ